MNTDPTFKTGVYRHFRTGDLYTAFALELHHHTRQPMVIYYSHAKKHVNVRPLNGWAEDPDAWNDLVPSLEGRLVKRFELVQELPDGYELESTFWGYGTSANTEFWQGAGTREEAVASALEMEGAEAWIQEGISADPAEFVPNFDEIVDIMNQSASDNGCPDEIDDAFTFAEGAKEALETALAAWAQIYVKANWWTPVGKPERVKQP